MLETRGQGRKTGLRPAATENLIWRNYERDERLVLRLVLGAVSVVGAAGEQRNKDHQVRQSEQPLVRLLACGFRRPRNKAQVPVFREITNVVDANAGQVGNFCVGKDLLARLNLNGNHGLVPLALCHRALKFYDARLSVSDAQFLEQ